MRLLSAGVEVAVGRVLLPVVDVGVYLGRRKIRVPQQLLHRPQIRPSCEHMRREAVAQEMRIDVFADSRLQCGRLDDPEYALAP